MPLLSRFAVVFCPSISDVLEREGFVNLNCQWLKPVCLPLAVVPGPPCTKRVLCEPVFLLSKKIVEKVNSSTIIKCVKCVR